MPLYLRLRKKTLREEVLTKNKLKEIENSEEEDDSRSVDSKFSKSSAESLYSSSLKGSFLRNKLDNPLFKSFFSKRSTTMSKVRNASDDESEAEDEENFDFDERVEEQRFRRRSIFFRRPTLFRKNTLKSNQRPSRLSSSSHSSETSSESSQSEREVDILTKLEEEAESHLLYTQKGNCVKVQFFFDYLQITPVAKKMVTPRVIYYEDLAMWTNNDDCLRMVHIKNKHTALQERSEIKLFVNKKKKSAISTKELNEELKKKVSILLANRMNIDTEEARELLEKNAKASEDEVDRVVQQIDRNGQKCIAQSYSRIDRGEDETCYELLNV